jgi:hypothetical protein
MSQSEGKCTLAVGGTVVFTARQGAPEAEYVLFDAGEIELRASEPGVNREARYVTTVADARSRIVVAGYTPEIVREAADAAHRVVAKAYARGSAVRAVADQLGPDELFEASTFDGTAGTYDGTWLDLAALASDLPLPWAMVGMRALHFATLLASRDDDESVVLDTAELMALKRPGQRTYRRVTLGPARELVEALAAFQRARPRPGSFEASRREVLGWVRDRARTRPHTRPQWEALERVLWARDVPARGPLAETAMWNVETKITRGEYTGVADQIDAIEQRRGRVPGTIYLRARLALSTKTEEPRAIAERISALSTAMSNFHELQLLASQAWLAASDPRRSRAFARDLADNSAADEVLRMQAQEVLESAGESSSSLVQPAGRGPSSGRNPISLPHPASSSASPAIQPNRIVSVTPAARAASDAPTPRSPEMSADVRIPRAPATPSNVGAVSAFEPAGPPRTTTRPGLAAPSRPSATMRTLPPGTSLPPYRVEPRGERAWSSPPPRQIEVESVESLTLPPGFQEDSPPPQHPPRTAQAARHACTLLARELGRELRQRFGVDLNDDLSGIETAQRYLRESLVDGRVRTPEEEREVMRHGGLLSELLARRLGARWVDLEAPEPGRWAMLVPSQTRPEEVARIWPFARVLRFVAMGHKERDLVSYYLELEARAR